MTSPLRPLMAALADVAPDAAVTARLDRTVTPPRLHVDLIWVPATARGRGVAETALTALLAHADSAGWQVAVEPSSGFGADLRRLVPWYSRHGFRLVGPGRMLRPLAEAGVTRIG